MPGKQRLATLAASALALALFAGAVVAQQPSPPLPKPDTPPPVPPILQNYKPVTAERLKQPEDGNWLMYRRTYDGWGYSPLSQITTENAGRLKPVWTLATGQIEGHQAPPTVNNGVMFVATPGNQLLAIDAKAGNVLWRFKRPIPEDMLLLHPTSRGVGLLDDKVYFAAADAVLIALDAKTGNEVWKTTVEDYNKGYYMTLAPLVADGKVMVGVSGGELGVRGFIAAFDAETGKSLWKTYTVPAPGEPGSETWPTGDQWKTGGGSVWITGSYDPETNLAFWGTGNGGPWMGDQRPGDNLFTSSTVALDASTGKIKGYHQYHPNDSWDWDEVPPPILVDYQHDGKAVKGLVYVARDGYLWMLERTADKINFIDGKPFVKQNVFKSLDPKTGRPDVDPARQPGTGKKADFCPSLWGGKDWPPVAYSPKTRLLYIPANENFCSTITGEKVTYTPGQRYTGAVSTFYLAPGADHIGELQA
jgi:alcohol dehydrogenase (cytochrome c)